MDRTRASSNLGSGLLMASIALAVFALCFVAAIIYIG
jgi:hypothetical protein